MRSFFQQAGRIYFDESPCTDVNAVSDLDLENIALFRLNSRLNNSISNQQVFQNLKLFTKEGYLKNGAFYFLEKNQNGFLKRQLFDVFPLVE